MSAPGSGSALLLPVASEDTVWELVRAGVLLPRKSISFGPKPTAGQLGLRSAGPVPSTRMGRYVLRGP
ncbi:hypothetical protein [Streptomyces sp. KR55]|uniref:hypothetical protein n=1 Tax=Streptomyces sp. KR55 TaxID=3457425 RepID=UPI003FD4326D